MTAHEEGSFRSMAWSHNNNYLLTCDTAGIIKYWSPSIAPVKELSSHNGQAIHALSFSPSDTKFVSCGDDSMVRIWDWASHAEERVLKDHGWDVKSVDWHPRSSVIASGSKDNVVKVRYSLMCCIYSLRTNRLTRPCIAQQLWDPRVGTCLSTLYGHKNTVTKVAWNPNGNWLVTASRDQLIKLYDIRAMKEMQSMKGHDKEVSSVAWHPLCDTVLASGGMVRNEFEYRSAEWPGSQSVRGVVDSHVLVCTQDGTLIFWNVGGAASDEPAAKVPFAHDMAIWDMQWHPAGHMLATGSNDRQTKFWARNRPGSSESRSTSTNKDSGAAGNKDEIIKDEIELKNHVGIVIGRKGQTIISMQRSTGTKMHVDQLNRTLLIEGTAAQIATVRKRVGALLERVSNEDNRRNEGPMMM